MEKTIPMIDLKAQYLELKDELDTIIQDTLNQTSFIGGKYVSQFEDDFKKITGEGFVISCANGTDSMEMILKALNIGEGDEVLVPAMTWISTSGVVIANNATPVFVDVDYETACINVSEIESKITPKTKAIIAVHLYGHPADLQALTILADKYNLFLIEDCAQAHGTLYQEKPVGSWGIASSYSFYPGKNLGAYGDGGAVFTKDENLANLIRMIGNHGQYKKHDHQIHGRNSRLDTLQARILSIKIPHLKNWIERKNKIAEYYKSELSVIEEIDLPIVKENAHHSWHLFVIKTSKRDELQRFLKDHNIQTGIHYPLALPFQKCYESYNHVFSDFPAAYSLQSKVLSLPMYAELTDDQVRKVTSVIKKFFNS